jgi:sugar porter (SP) family MFS transporter
MNRALFLAISAANLLGLLSGFGIAVINGALPFLTMEFQLDSGMQGWAVYSMFIGAVLGALLIGRSSDFFGRRPVLMAVALIFLVSAVATGVASNFNFFLFFRFITGIAIGGTTVLSPVYISELSPPKLRGRLVASFQLSCVIGILLAFLSDYMLSDTGANNWRFMFIAGGVPVLLFFLLLVFVPESPRYLMQRGLEHETDVVIRRINPDIDKYQFMKEFKESLNIKILSSNGALLKPSFSRLLFIGIAIGMFNQFTGVNVVMFYVTDFFRSRGLTANSGIVPAMTLGMINFVFTIVAMIFIDKTGRKKLLMLGSIGMAFCLFLLTLLFIAGLEGSTLILLVMAGFVGFFAVSQGTVLWVLLSEMFPNSIRVRGAAIGSSSFWFFNLLISFLFPIFIGSIGVAVLFAFFTATTLGSLFFFRKYLVETKGRSLESMVGR